MTGSSSRGTTLGTDSRHDVIDLFAGPGGWDEGAASIGLTDILGIELDPFACATAEAAGHDRLQGSVTNLEPTDFAGITGLIASPPCQAWSMAGKGDARADQARIIEAAHARGKGIVYDRADVNMLALEPLHWTLAARPEWTCWEQVQPVEDLWRTCATILEQHGYNAWAGVLSAERYGVPQTRRRAFLIASRVQTVAPPQPTHQRFVPGEPARHVVTLEGELLPWISMAEALGWGFDEQPSPTVSGGGGRDNGIGVFAGQAQRERLRAIVLNTHRDQRPDGSTQTRHVEEPAPTLTAKAGGQWMFERPATTVAGDPRIAAAGHHDRQMNDAVRVSLSEALTLQGFRPDYPVAGNQGKRFEQVGNAVPPPLAAAVLSTVLTNHNARRLAG